MKLPNGLRARVVTIESAWTTLYREFPKAIPGDHELDIWTLHNSRQGVGRRGVKTGA